MVWAIGNAGQSAALQELIKSQNSDRIVAILGAAVLDDALKGAMESRFRCGEPGSTDINQKLFRVTGPLGNLQPKIDVGYQLYMFEKPTRNAMYGIADIRNLFAHRLDMSFDSPDKAMADAAKKLRLHEGVTHYFNPAPASDVTIRTIDPADTVRDKFIVNLKLCLIWLAGDDYRHLPFSNAAQPVSWPGTPPQPNEPHHG
jgi:hypothetical protein